MVAGCTGMIPKNLYRFSDRIMRKM